ncbi:MAG: peptidoglycan DD-metalloendopeptidase family protein [Lachnospiraceae bacterium]|nr:peptidoglycan DD-metalloendopeptidase family protein [Lachnospiraceae bacterium]MBR1876187.1 peptidoglycan DD-metalloendopeptidase family protein [Lachnospiraceae bacterium]
MDNEEIREREKKAPASFSVLMVPDEGGSVHSFRTSADFMIIIAVVFVLLIIGGVYYMMKNAETAEALTNENNALKDRIRALSEDVIVLEADKENLERELRSVNALLESKSVAEEIEQQTEEMDLNYVPTSLPVAGTLSVPSPYSEENKYITFTTGAGSKVVASADGRVVYSGESVEHGYAVRVDHENGYVTTYYEETQPVAEEGKNVRRGDTLFEIEGDNQVLTYQIAYEDEFIDPYTVMDIDG